MKNNTNTMTTNTIAKSLEYFISYSFYNSFSKDGRKLAV
jgi:hypothetical protein